MSAASVNRLTPLGDDACVPATEVPGEHEAYTAIVPVPEQATDGKEAYEFDVPDGRPPAVERRNRVAQVDVGVQRNLDGAA